MFTHSVWQLLGSWSARREGSKIRKSEGAKLLEHEGVLREGGDAKRRGIERAKLTHRQHPPVSIELPHPVTSASLHPFLRDRFIAGSTNDPWVRVYDLDSGKEKEVYKGHHGPVLCASYSPDGEVYASGSEDGESLVICVDQYTWTIADEQERYDYGRRILEKAMVYGRLASSFPGDEWVKEVEEDKRGRARFTETRMYIIDHSRYICIIGSSFQLVSDCVLEVT